MQRTEKAVLSVIRDMAPHAKDISRETNLQDVVVDEVALQFALEAGLGITLTDADMASVRTVGDLIDRCLGW